MNNLTETQVRGVLLPTSHYTKTATERTPKGTLMLHYALTEFGSKEVEEEYFESKGEFADQKVKTGKYKDSPIHFTSQIFDGINEGDEVIFDFINERLQRSEDLAQRMEKSKERKSQQALSKVLSPETIAKLQMAKQLGLNVSI